MCINRLLPVSFRSNLPVDLKFEFSIKIPLIWGIEQPCRLTFVSDHFYRLTGDLTGFRIEPEAGTIFFVISEKNWSRTVTFSSIARLLKIRYQNVPSRFWGLRKKCWPWTFELSLRTNNYSKTLIKGDLIFRSTWKWYHSSYFFEENPLKLLPVTSGELLEF